MKKIFILLMMLPLLLSFEQEKPFKDGKYTNLDEMVYAVEIFDNGTKIRFYLRDDEKDKSYDMKTFISGDIRKVKYKYFIQRIDGTHISKRRQKELEMKTDGDAVVFQTYYLLNDFYDEFTVNSDELKFKPQSN